MIGKNILAYLPVNLAAILTSFGTIAILTRILDGAEFGRYALAVVAIQFVHMSFLTWVEAALSRYQARAEREGNINTHLKTVFAYTALCSVIGVIVILATLWLLPISDLMKTILGFALTSTCIQVFFNLSIEAHKASHRILRYSFSHTSYMLLSFSVGIALILLTPLREVAPFIGIFVANFVILAFEIPFFLKRMKGGVIEHARAKKYFLYGMPLCFSLVLSYALSSADIFIIKALMGDMAVGQYNAGYNLANRSLDVVFLWLGTAILPLIVTTFEDKGVAETQEILKQYGTAILWITLPAATGIALVSEQAGFIIGESVRDKAVMIMPYIAFAALMNGFIAYYIQRAFVLSGHTGMFAICLIPPTLLNLVLNFALIPTFGLMGAVYATLAAYSLGLLISFIVARRYFPIPMPVRAFCEVSATCAFMAFAVITLPLPQNLPMAGLFFLKSIIGGCVYAAVCYTFNVVNCRVIIKEVLIKLKTRNTDRETETETETETDISLTAEVIS